jgi:hypothetical protein
MSPLKPALLAARKRSLGIVKLLVLAFWIGGGWVAGVIAPICIHRSMGSAKQEEATRLSNGIFIWFTISEIATGALLFAILFFAERARKRTLATLGALVLITLVDLSIALLKQQYESTTSSFTTLHTVCLSLFFFAMAIASVFFVVVALEGPPQAPSPASPPSPPAPAAAPDAAAGAFRPPSGGSPA